MANEYQKAWFPFRKYRNDARVSILQLHKELGVSRTTLHKLDQGTPVRTSRVLSILGKMKVLPRFRDVQMDLEAEIRSIHIGSLHRTNTNAVLVEALLYDIQIATEKIRKLDRSVGQYAMGEVAQKVDQLAKELVVARRRIGY